LAFAHGARNSTAWRAWRRHGSSLLRRSRKAHAVRRILDASGDLSIRLTKLYNAIDAEQKDAGRIGTTIVLVSPLDSLQCNGRGQSLKVSLTPALAGSFCVQPPVVSSAPYNSIRLTRIICRCITEGTMGRTMRAFILLPSFLLCLGTVSAIQRLWKIERVAHALGDHGDDRAPIELTRWHLRLSTGGRNIGKLARTDAECGAAAQMQTSSLTGKRAGAHRTQSQASKVGSASYARLLSGVWHASRTGPVTAPGTMLLVSGRTPHRTRFHRLAPIRRSSS